jgi:hypothetical protein
MKVTAAIYAEASALLAEFGWRVDNGEGPTVAELFSEGATLETPQFKLEDRDAIHDWFSQRATKTSVRISRHCSTNIRVSPQGDGRYLVQANALTFVGAAPAPAQGLAFNVGTSTDVVEETPAGLRFVSRRLEVVGEARAMGPEAVA